MGTFYRLQPRGRADLPTESTTWTDGEDVRQGCSACHSIEALIEYFATDSTGRQEGRASYSRTTRAHLETADLLTIEGTWSDELDHDHDRAAPFGPTSPVLVLDGVIVARRPLTEAEIAEILVCDLEVMS